MPDFSLGVPPPLARAWMREQAGGSRPCPWTGRTTNGCSVRAGAMLAWPSAGSREALATLLGWLANRRHRRLHRKLAARLDTQQPCVIRCGGVLFGRVCLRALAASLRAGRGVWGGTSPVNKTIMEAAGHTCRELASLRESGDKYGRRCAT